MCWSRIISQLICLLIVKITTTSHFKVDFKFNISYIKGHTKSSLQTFSTLVEFKHFSTKKKSHDDTSLKINQPWTNSQKYFILDPKDRIHTSWSLLIFYPSTPTSFSSDELHLAVLHIVLDPTLHHQALAMFAGPNLYALHSILGPFNPLDQMSPTWTVQTQLEQTPQAAHCPKQILKNHY